jgi:hypothetical protein
MNAWKESSPQNPILRKIDGSMIALDVRNKILSEFGYYRKWLILFAIIAATILTYVDTEEERLMFFGDNYAVQLEAACEDPDFLGKWLFLYEVNLKNRINTCAELRPYKVYNKKIVQEKKLDIKKEKIINKRRNIPTIKAPWHQIMITTVSYFFQFNIFALGFLALFQMIAQPVFFGIFHILKIPKKYQLIIYLDHKSPFEDFGLGKWNQAVDRQFWSLFIALIPAFISMASQPLGQPDTGQVIGGALLIILVWAPAILCYASRIKWKDQSRDRVSIAGDETIIKYNKQKVWPFENNMSTKAGFALSVLVLGLIVKSTILLKLGL